MMPPLITVGSSPPASSSAATIEVVVVLPWVPAMATQERSRISSASISARRTTGSTLRARGGELRIVALDRGRDDDHVGVAEIFGIVADRDRDALVAQPLDIGALGQVGALHAYSRDWPAPRRCRSCRCRRCRRNAPGRCRAAASCVQCPCVQCRGSTPRRAPLSSVLRRWRLSRRDRPAVRRRPAR